MRCLAIAQAPTRSPARGQGLHSRLAAYDGLTPHELTRLLRATYGKLGWQAQAARDMLMSKRGIFRWAKGVHKISHANERLPNYRYVLALFRRAVAAANAREELASLPRHRPMTRL